MCKQRDDDSGQGGYASPPCFMHELDPAYLGLTPEPDRQPRIYGKRRCKAERERLIEADRRRHQTERIAAALDDTPDDVAAES